MATAAVGADLEIRLLGPVEVVQDGRAVRLGGPRQRALLAALALQANEVVSVERLVLALFGVDAPDTAANAVQVAVSRLRRQLDPSLLETKPGGYVLRVHPDQLDLLRFEQLLAQGRELLRRGDPAEAVVALHRAIELFRGEPLADIAGEEFAQSEIRRVASLRLEAVIERVEAELRTGRGGELVPELEALVEQHPLQERLRAQLMLALYRAGRQSDALEEFRRIRELLREELGLEPSRVLHELEVAILQHDPALDVLEPVVPKSRVVACPFKGLAPFTLDDGEIFFGRTRVVDALVARVAAATFVGIVGPSGSGKSSVLQAGFIRALRSGALPGSDTWRVLVLRPGDALPEAEDIGAERAVVAIDQLEELFTLPRNDEQRGAYLGALVRLAVDPKRRFVVVAALRADFYGRCAAFADFASLLSENHVLLGAMRRDELVEAIQEPAARGGLQVQPALVDALVADVQGKPGALPLLSSSLLELWQERDDHVLTATSYRMLGGVRGAIARLAETAYARLGDDERQTARTVLLRLAAEEDGAVVRRRVLLDELGSDDERVARVLTVLTDARLLTISEKVVEVSHEALLTEWPRLRDWLDDDRDGRRVRSHLAASARDWAERGRNPSDLYRGPRLADALEWAEARPSEPTALERAFLDESRGERERELSRQRRRNRQLLTLLVGTGLLLAAALAAGAVALVQRHDARQKATAALAGQVGAEAVSQPRVDLAMLLGAEAVRLNDSPQTESTLLATLLRSPAVVSEISTPIDVRPQRLTVAPDDRTVAVSDNTGEVRFYDAPTRRPKRVAANFGQTVAVTYIHRGAEIAGLSFGPRPSIALRDAHTLKLLGSLPLDRRFVTHPSDGFDTPVATQDGSTVFWAWELVHEDGSPAAGFVDRWDVPHRRLVSVTPTGGTGVSAIQLVDEDRRLIVVGAHAAAVFNTATMRRLRAVPVPDNTAASISPDGGTVAVGSSLGVVTFVRMSDGTGTQGAGAHSAGVGAIAFSPDGRLVASGAEDGSVIVWNAATGDVVQRLVGHANRILGIAFSPDGHTLWSCSLDGAIFGWDIRTSRRFGLPFAVPGGTEYGLPDIDPSPALAISGDGSRIAVRSGRKTALLLATKNGHVLRTLTFRHDVDALALSPRRPLLAVTGPNGLIELWDVAGTPRLVRRLRGLHSINHSSEAAETVAFSPDGTVLAAGDVNHTPGQTPYRFGTVALWDVTSGRLHWLVRNRAGWVHGLTFSADGATVAAAQEDGVVRLYDESDGKLVRTLTLYGGAHANALLYEALAYSSDGQIATGLWSGIAQLWDAHDGRELTAPKLVAAAPVSSLAFDPTGRLVATVGGSDGALKLWQTPGLASFGGQFPLDPGTWGTAAFTPDGSSIVVLFSDGHGMIWPATVGAWLRHACAVAGRNLTRDEWGRYLGSAPYEKTCS